MLLEYVPSLHGSAALAPTGQYDPSLQATHVFSPSPAWYVPAVHLLHVPLPASGWTVPGLHLDCSVLPVGEKWPLSVGVHWSVLVRLDAFEYVPSSHGSAALAPVGQYVPRSQKTQACSPSPFWYVPAAHLVHAPMLALDAMVPGLHAVCLVLPVGA